MKPWLLINLSLLLIAVTAQTAHCPRGAWFTVIRVQETSTGTVLTDLSVWQGVSG